jgi:radical SAM superfamily enzyme YgiQ (UPF0313 family)
MRVALIYPNEQKCANQGPGYIASAAMHAGHHVDFYDTAYIPLHAAAVRVAGGGYDAVLISASTLFYPQATYAASVVKNSSDVRVVLGGLHATVLKSKVLEDCPYIDYLCIGEGEEFIIDFLAGLQDEDISQMPNLVYRTNQGTIQVNSVRPCPDLNYLPPYRHDLFHPDSIVQPYPKPGFCYVYATRGCPYNCSYCANSCYLDLYGRDFLRTRNIDSVIRELLWLKEKYPVKFFYFGDEMLLLNRDYCEELFTRVYREVELPYGCMARVERINEYIVDLLQRTGCGYVGMGVECADEQFRREFLNRHMTNEQITQAFRLLRTIPKITLTAFWMCGWPVSYDDELTELTLEFCKSLNPDFRQRNIFYPFPGTKLYDYCIERDLIDWEKARSVRNVSTMSVLKEIVA